MLRHENVVVLWCCHNLKNKEWHGGDGDACGGWCGAKLLLCVSITKLTVIWLMWKWEKRADGEGVADVRTIVVWWRLLWLGTKQTRYIIFFCFCFFTFLLHCEEKIWCCGDWARCTRWGWGWCRSASGGCPLCGGWARRRCDIGLWCHL